VTAASKAAGVADRRQGTVPAIAARWGFMHTGRFVLLIDARNAVAPGSDAACSSSHASHAGPLWVRPLCPPVCPGRSGSGADRVIYRRDSPGTVALGHSLVCAAP
jgi:hypothetical protein